MKKALIDALAAALMGMALFVALTAAYNTFPSEPRTHHSPRTECEALNGGELRFDGQPSCQLTHQVLPTETPHGGIGTAATATAAPLPQARTAAPSAIVSSPTVPPSGTVSAGWVCTSPPAPFKAYCYRPIIVVVSSARTNP